MTITLATLPQATTQEVFDQVVNHLKTQNARSANNTGCAYRSGDLKCAAGCLIADNEYKPEMDKGTSIGEEYLGSSWNDLNKRGLVPVEHLSLITTLQGIHDNNYNKVDFFDNIREDLKEVAKQFGLVFNA